MAKPVPRIRKHKTRARLEGSRKASNTDSNAELILPESKDDRNARRDALRKDLALQQPVSKLSSQKKKRLDKYIDTKLRKEANQDLIKKLSQQNVDTSRFKSAKTLGKGKTTRRERLTEALQAEKAGFATKKTHDVLYERRSDAGELSDSDSDPDRSDRDDENDGRPALRNPGTQGPLFQRPHMPVNDQMTASFGSGLKRPLDVDASGKPVIQQRKRAKPSPKSDIPLPSPDSEEEWSGFSSASEADQDNDDGHGIDEEKEALLSELLNAPSSSDESDSDEQDGESGEDVPDDSDEDGSDESEEPSESDEAEESSSEKGDEANTDRISNFKAWAMSQRNEASGYVPVRAPDLTAMPPSMRPKSATAQVKQPVIPNFDVPESEHKGRRAYHVDVSRSEEMQEGRAKLPVVGKEQEIMETVFTNDCTIVTGATGSGKTTQVPQFLFEAGYGAPGGPTPGMIGITQPRRVAAVSMAQRVAYELCDHGQKVSHQIRFDSTVSSSTAIKFMTDGVLLREVSQDFLLTKYSAIVIDEAHERSVNTDILIGMLTRIVETRAKLAQNGDEKVKPLKLIIMSATLRIADFTTNTKLFRSGPPPVVEAEGKAHPVVTHFARRTHREYVNDAIDKVSRGHRKLPPGGMLVFLTGQNEIVEMSNKLKERFEPTEECLEQAIKMKVSAADAVIEDEEMDFGRGGKMNEKNDYLSSDDDDDEQQEHNGSRIKAPEDLDFDIEPEEARVLQRVHVLPLYSQLPSHLQMRVFKPPPDGSRLIVLATNVAETSLTIPGIRYVFDSGRSKEKSYEPSTGVQSFDVDWISKASAEQRRGRAGRTGPGHCYRLYSSAVYENHFVQHAAPEIQRVPVEGVVLQLKSMDIPDVASFPFPTPPNPSALAEAVRLLENLDAIRDGKVTRIGRSLSHYPVSPRLARMLVAAEASDCQAHAIALVSMLSAQEVLIPESQFHFAAAQQGQNDQRRAAYNSFHAHSCRLDRQSDALKLLTVFADYTADPTSRQIATYTRPKALAEVQQLRRQLARLAMNNSSAQSQSSLNSLTVNPLPVTSQSQSRLLRVLLTAGYIDQIAQRADLSPRGDTTGLHPRTAAHVPYVPLTGTRSADAGDGYVYVHASSALAHCAPEALPRFVVYSHLSRAAPATVPLNTATTRPTRVRMHPLTHVSPETLTVVARGTPLLGEGKPIGKIERLSRAGSGEERRRVWCVPFLKGRSEAGAVEWPLPPARQVVQRRVVGKGWVEETDGKEE